MWPSEIEIRCKDSALVALFPLFETVQRCEGVQDARCLVWWWVPLPIPSEPRSAKCRVNRASELPVRSVGCELVISSISFISFISFNIDISQQQNECPGSLTLRWRAAGGGASNWKKWILLLRMCSYTVGREDSGAALGVGRLAFSSSTRRAHELLRMICPVLLPTPYERASEPVQCQKIHRAPHPLSTLAHKHPPTP